MEREYCFKYLLLTHINYFYSNTGQQMQKALPVSVVLIATRSVDRVAYSHAHCVNKLIDIKYAQP